MDSVGRERPTSRSRIQRKNVLLHALVVLLCFLFIYLLLNINGFLNYLSKF